MAIHPHLRFSCLSYSFLTCSLLSHPAVPHRRHGHCCLGAFAIPLPSVRKCLPQIPSLLSHPLLRVASIHCFWFFSSSSLTDPLPPLHWNYFHQDHETTWKLFNPVIPHLILTISNTGHVWCVFVGLLSSLGLPGYPCSLQSHQLILVSFTNSASYRPIKIGVSQDSACSSHFSCAFFIISSSPTSLPKSPMLATSKFTSAG